MEFFSTLYSILTAKSPESKFKLFEELYECAFLSSGGDSGETALHSPSTPPTPEALLSSLSFGHEGEVLPLQSPSYSAFLDVVKPSGVPRRNRLDTREGVGRLLHSIAHIEYSAVDLALDACYRFRRMPPEFYVDWLEVAREEVVHFGFLTDLLEKLGYGYGSFPVHDGLMEAARRTPDLLSRMAVVPRFLEARGLDVNPGIMKKLEESDAPLKTEILDALQVILRDEIDHVRKGDRWFRHACEETGNSPEVYLEIVARHFPSSAKNRSPLNVEARLAAGFSCEEINAISGSSLCHS